MKDAFETDPVLVLVDVVIDDLAVGSARFVAAAPKTGMDRALCSKTARRDGSGWPCLI